MTKILFINACVRENSRTLELAKAALCHLDGEVDELKLYDIELSPLDADGMMVRDAAFMAKDFSDERFALARQFAAANTIVIAAPYWDLTFPSILKVYIENVTVSGLTFVYGERGIPEGLCSAKRLIYVTTSGGPIIHNFGYDYVCTIAKSFFGIEDVRGFSAQGLDIRGADVAAIMQKAKDCVANELSES